MAYSATATRPSTSAMPDASRTLTVVETEAREETPSGDEGVGTLHLRGARNSSRNSGRVVWREDVVDNEGAGRKSSKICCIYHKPRAFDESSDESSSDSDSDSDSSCDSCNVPHHHGAQQRPDRPVPNTNGAGQGSTRSRNGGASTAVVHEVPEDGDANAYERPPGKKPKKQGKGKPIPPRSQH